MSSRDIKKEYISTAELAIKLGVHPESIRRSHRKNQLPFSPTIIAHTFYWNIAEVEKGLAATKKNSTPYRINVKRGRPTKASTLAAQA